MQTWGSDLLIKESKEDPDRIEVRHKDIFGRTVVHNSISPDLPTFTLFLAHLTTPEAPAPGLNLTYSRTIGALHALWRQQYLEADFKVEQDRLLAAIRRLTTETTYSARPEFSETNPNQESTRFIEQSSDTTTLEGTNRLVP